MAHTDTKPARMSRGEMPFQLLNLTPIVGLVVAIVFLAERPSPIQHVGGGLVLLAVVVLVQSAHGEGLSTPTPVIQSARPAPHPAESCRPTAWINAAGLGRGDGASAALAQVLGYVDADVLEPGGFRFPLEPGTVGPGGEIADPEYRSSLQQAMVGLATAVLRRKGDSA